MVAVSLKKSKMQGIGVFAERNFKKDEVILEIDDTHIVKDYSKLTQKQKEFDCDYLAHGLVILMQEPERSINHSCDPNIYVKTVNSVRQVLAMRDIKVGEEITFDYAINGDNDGTFICHCGSRNCRGVYHGSFFKLPRVIQIKYLPYLDEWFIKNHKAKLKQIVKSE